MVHFAITAPMIFAIVVLLIVGRVVGIARFHVAAQLWLMAVIAVVASYLVSTTLVGGAIFAVVLFGIAFASALAGEVQTDD